MMTHRERMLAAMRGEMPDLLPYVPRIDLWYNANSIAGTLPERHRGKTQDEISRAEGWALHKMVPEFLTAQGRTGNLHRAIGLFALKEVVYDFRFPPDVEIEVTRRGDATRLAYHTPLGSVSTTTVFTEEMRRSGISITWVDEHIIKKPEDYRVVAYLFEHLEVVPAYEDFVRWKEETGEDGVAITFFGGAASPMHHIQKDFVDATGFYYNYEDHRREMRMLAEALERFYARALQVIADSPAEAVNWGGNFDDMITYAPYFRKEITPWIRKAGEVLGEKGKFVVCHCDGENQGLMDLIRDSGMHVAEAICPYPMTKVRIEDYYRRWADKITLFGGIPSNMLLAESASDEEFEAYLDHLFAVVAPGRRLILGIADTTPPNAVFDRLVRIGERVEKEARLPLEGGAYRPLSPEQVAKTAERLSPEPQGDDAFRAVRDDVYGGDHEAIKGHVAALLETGLSARAILDQGLLAAMETIGEKFKKGDLFIPEVLLSARAMNEALTVLEPHLAQDKKSGSGRILMGTVRGDLHDIGKNLVITMLRGVGFEVLDLGVNVPTEEILRQVREQEPDILGLSSLLTTTMPELKRAVEALKAQGLRDRTRVMVGGAPVNAKFARDIGADGYAPDAGEAVSLAKALMRGEQAL